MSDTSIISICILKAGNRAPLFIMARFGFITIIIIIIIIFHVAQVQ